MDKEFLKNVEQFFCRYHFLKKPLLPCLEPPIKLSSE